MSLYIRNYIKNLQSDIDLISNLQNEYIPSSVPPLPRYESMISILYTFTGCTIFHILTLLFFRYSCTTDFCDKNKNQIIKASHQITNLCANLILGLWGSYIWITCVPSLLSSSLSIIDVVSSFQEFTSFAIFQIGYNLWSLSMGLWVVDESREMIGHHVAVVCTASSCCFNMAGLRYYAPFFLGAFEISSVPLAIMNMTKYEWRSPNKDERYNLVLINIHKANKIWFGITFLIVRVILGTPQMYSIIRSGCILCYTCQTFTCSLTTGIFCLCCLGLAYLQYLWGYLIIKALVRLFFGNDKNKKM